MTQLQAKGQDGELAEYAVNADLENKMDVAIGKRPGVISYHDSTARTFATSTKVKRNLPASVQVSGIETHPLRSFVCVFVAVVNVKK